MLNLSVFLKISLYLSFSGYMVWFGWYILSLEQEMKCELAINRCINLNFLEVFVNHYGIKCVIALATSHFEETNHLITGWQQAFPEDLLSQNAICAHMGHYTNYHITMGNSHDIFCLAFCDHSYLSLLSLSGWPFFLVHKIQPIISFSFL